jgi:DNA-binding GntR family transcriptional regulator
VDSCLARSAKPRATRLPQVSTWLPVNLWASFYNTSNYNTSIRQVRVPRYIQVANQLKADLSSSTCTKGDLLASESEMVARFRVSRITVRRALELLRSEGLITPRQGVGWLVAKEPYRQVLGRFSTIEEQLEAQGIKTERRIVGSRLLVASGRQEEVLGGGELMEVTRVNLAGGEPFAKVIVWLASHLGKGLSLADLEQHSFYDLLGRSGQLKFPLARAVQSIAATILSSEDATDLMVAEGSAGLLCERITFDIKDNPILYSRYIFPAARAVFEVELGSHVDSIAPTGLRLVE